MLSGYGPAIRTFTKLLKGLFSTLRKQEFSSIAFVDDMFLQGDTYIECQQNVFETVNLLRSYGFTIHPEKSIFEPTLGLTFLGFAINL